MTDGIQLIVGDCAGATREGDARVLHDEVWAELDAALRALGLGAWAYTAVPECYAGPARTPLRLTTYPAGHVRGCLRERLYPHSVGLAYAFGHAEAAPFGLVRARAEVTPHLQQHLALNRRFGVTRGAVIPLHNVLGTVGMLAAAFDGSEPKWQALWHARRDSLVELAHGFHRTIHERHARSFNRDLIPTLTERQRQLLNLVVRGHGVEQTADRLGVSVHTVNKHIAEIKRRLHAKSSAHMTALALHWGLL